MTEGATNVIRHSRAHRCIVKIGAGLGNAWLEMIDDGIGSEESSVAGDGSGHGLAGLAERVSELRGRVEVGIGPEGGFRLAVTVPTAAS